MPDPLPSDVVARLKSDPLSALAAALILVGAFPDLVAWAVSIFSPSSEAEKKPEVGVSATGDIAKKKANGGGASEGARAKGRHNPSESAAKHDQALLTLMQANPGASVTEIIRLNGRPRNSTILSLERLQKAELIEHVRRGKWTVVDPDLRNSPSPKPAGWIEPLSGAHVARHAAGGRVRDELTMA